MIRAEITVTGLVQGVGFRPFCHRLAVALQLKGIVKNTGDAGVFLAIEGEKHSVEEFLRRLQTSPPPRARVEEIRVEWKPATGEFMKFTVVESDVRSFGPASIIPPEIAICDDCLREMLTPSDRRYRYPFTTCVNCGPRFTVIELLPYDRERTSMRDFPLCERCLREYRDPGDRRYHAESTCCPECGPKFTLMDAGGTPVESGDPFEGAIRLLDEGKLLAVKGLGGTHITAKTTADAPIARLRKALGRPQQPFAVMARSLEAAETFAEIGEKERELLVSPAHPILVLKKSKKFELSELISPGLDSIGVMLPYSGFHHLLFGRGKDPAYILTSANFPGLPMITKNEEALKELQGIVDYLLLHNRRIVNRCDDSVVRQTAGEAVFLRRSRGHAPMPVDLKIDCEGCVVALGAELNVATSVLLGKKCFLTQHIGDVSKIETLEYLREATENLLRLLRVEKIDGVACDLHPQYATTKEAEEMAEEMGVPLVKVQHHHAHLSSLMAEHGVDEAVGIVADGAGYGSNGRIWGGEVMVVEGWKFRRTGSLIDLPMPGGDLATTFPARMVAGALWGVLERVELERALMKISEGFPRGALELRAVLRQLETGVNVFMTSSCGRVLDAISCLLGVCHKRTYEGEPAMKLEALGNRGDPKAAEIHPELRSEKGIEVVDTRMLFLQILEALKRRVPKQDIAAGAQWAIADGLAQVAVATAKREGIKAIGVSGGVFYNDLMTKTVRKRVTSEGLRFLMHKEVPPGDGGISLGQAFVAALKLRSRSPFSLGTSPKEGR